MTILWPLSVVLLFCFKATVFSGGILLECYCALSVLVGNDRGWLNNFFLYSVVNIVLVA